MKRNQIFRYFYLLEVKYATVWMECGFPATLQNLERTIGSLIIINVRCHIVKNIDKQKEQPKLKNSLLYDKDRPMYCDLYSRIDVAHHFLWSVSSVTNTPLRVNYHRLELRLHRLRSYLLTAIAVSTPYYEFISWTSKVGKEI